MHGTGRGMTDTQRKTVAVIGAGASGLCAAKHMLQAGFAVVVYEAGSHVGGLWVYDNDSGLSAAYQTLHINTDKYITQFDDFPLPDTASFFPHHTEMRGYLEDYADHCGVRDVIRFNTRVTDVSPVSRDDGEVRWRITDANGDEQEYDVAII